MYSIDKRYNFFTVIYPASSWESKLHSDSLDETLPSPLASIRNLDNAHYCAGIVISLFHVLTAAFCIYPFTTFLEIAIHVVVEGKRHEVIFMEYHENYDVLQEFDIGMITVS